MTDLVFLKGKTPLTTSLIVADGTQNQHESIIRLINEHKAHFERWGQIHFTDLKSGNKNGDMRGRPTRVALLNEQQATFLITLLRNNEIVLDFKSELVDRFYKMREVLLQRQSVEWQEVRCATKDGYKELSARLSRDCLPKVRTTTNRIVTSKQRLKPTHDCRSLIRDCWHQTDSQRR